MKSKNPTKHRLRDAAASSGREHDGERGKIIDLVQYRIETFNREQGGGVTVRKDRHGYTLVREDLGCPIARLRPQADKGKYEIYYRSPHTDRWRPIGSIGKTILTLDEALDFIAADPMDCFWS